MTGVHDGRNKKFYICVEVPYTLWKVVEASSIEEARKITEQLEPTDFNFIGGKSPCVSGE